MTVEPTKQPVPRLRLPSENLSPVLLELSPVPGYESISFSEAIQSPPRRDSVLTPEPTESPFEDSVPHMTEESAREALSLFVDENCCFGGRPSRNMKINDILMRSAIHYSLETFGEKRSAAWAFEPFTGEEPGRPGPVPGPWEVPDTDPPEMFQNATVQREVANTAQIRICHRCVGVGMVRCEACYGGGGTSCGPCGATGNVRNQKGDLQPCSRCVGTGTIRCNSCFGRCQVKCKVCKGHCQLKFFVQLTVVWTNHIGNNVSDTGQFPRELILGVTGKTAYEAQKQRVQPITHFPDQYVKLASSSLLRNHASFFPEERILQQRHRVRMVPIAEIMYTWNDRNGSFQIYGFENKVHFPDYPHQSCWGCQIL